MGTELMQKGLGGGCGCAEDAFVPGEPVAARKRPLISLVAPCYNEEEVLPLLIEQMTQLAANLDAEFGCDTQVVLVDDGSRDGTWDQIRRSVVCDGRILGVRLSRNFGQQAALTCGYALARGDAVVSLDADLQDPPEVVVEMVARWREGFDVVHGVHHQRQGETVFKVATAKLFYWLIRKLGVNHVRAQAGEFRLMSRRSVDALLKMGETDRFLRGMVGWMGFPAAEVHFERPPRAAGKSKWPAREMVRLAIDAIVSFSRLPLRLAYYSALGLSLAFLGYFGYLLAVHVWAGGPLDVSGLVLLLAVVAFGASNLLSQALLGEYTGRIHEQCRGRPLYIVQDLTDGGPLQSSERLGISRQMDEDALEKVRNA
ncbi:MAG: glycosyltransferase family 2 protein [Planctomycetes bacterium]|nr:glycosyltransferase family 2 protein [Planctomycetota bacterium]